MTEALALILAAFFDPGRFHCSSFVNVVNGLYDQTIEAVYAIPAGGRTVEELILAEPIEPGDTVVIRMDWGFYQRLVFVSSEDVHYYKYFYPASISPDTILIDLSLKEYGRYFDRVFGDSPIVLVNGTGVNISSVFLIFQGCSRNELLHGNMLMPRESMRIWLDDRASYSLTFIDVEDNLSDTIGVDPQRDSLVLLVPEQIYDRGRTAAIEGEGNQLSITSCLPSVEIVLAQGFSPDGALLFSVDLSQNPMQLWDRLTVPSPETPDAVSLTDQQGRQYTVSEPDSISGEYLFDLLTLDFDFSFPEDN